MLEIVMKIDHAKPQVILSSKSVCTKMLTLLASHAPNTMKSMIGKMLNSSNETLKWTGIISAVIGLIIIWLVKE